MISYAGIGARKTPEDVLLSFKYLGAYFGKKGYTLRSGGADGADSAFEVGADAVEGKKEIYLPWRDFNGRDSTLFPPSKEANEVGKTFHPNWDNLSQGVQKLMARNSHQILGPHLDSPVDFLVCWTPGGKGQGGTGQAIRIANHYNIPIIDFGKENAKETMNQLIDELNKKETGENTDE